MIVNEIQTSNQSRLKNKFKYTNDNINFGLKTQKSPARDEFTTSPVATYIKNKLKDEDTLYKLFNGIECDITPKILQNENFMQELYGDIDFLEASCSAIKRSLEDKLEDENLSKQEKSELTVLHNIFSFGSQKELQASSQLNTYNTVCNTVNRTTKLHNSTALAFGKSFFYLGVFDKPKTRREKAEAIVNRCATTAAAESGALLIGADIIFPGGSTVTKPLEPILLTNTTRTMCRKICKTYEMPGSAVTFLISQLTGYLIGNTASKTLTSYIPVVGGYINATTTYALHQAQGRAIITWCENNYNKPDISDWDNIAKAYRVFSAVDSLGPNPVDVLGDLDL